MSTSYLDELEPFETPPSCVKEKEEMPHEIKVVGGWDSSDSFLLLLLTISFLGMQCSVATRLESIDQSLRKIAGRPAVDPNPLSGSSPTSTKRTPNTDPSWKFVPDEGAKK